MILCDHLQNRHASGGCAKPMVHFKIHEQPRCMCKTGLTYCRQGEVCAQADDDDYFWDGVLSFLTISDSSNVLISFAGLLDSDKHFNCNIDSHLGLFMVGSGRAASMKTMSSEIH